VQLPAESFDFATWDPVLKQTPNRGWRRWGGGLGHLSHQNGLDVDIYYPRLDGLERAARRPDQVDRVLAQELVDRFVNFGAVKVFVGPRVHLSGRRSVVTPLVYHDDHLHVRLSPRRVNGPILG
jgi:murein endopeptidase